MKLTKRQREVLEHIARGFMQPIQSVRQYGIQAYSAIYTLRRNGLIWPVCHGYYRITEAGRKAMEAQQ